MSHGSRHPPAGYEEGLAQALRQMKHPGPVEAPDGAVSALAQSVHVAAPKRAALNSFATDEVAAEVTDQAVPKLMAQNSFDIHQESLTGPGVADAAGLEPTLGAFESAIGKNDAVLSVTGRTLGKCGTVLVTKLLEVLPLRSQSKGKGSKEAIFPLPSSRSIFLSFDPFMSDEVISWAQCVTFSLNSS